MIYILETDLHDKKPISFALTKIFGLNRSKAVKICKTLGLAQNLTFENLKKDQTLKLIKFIENSNTNINIDLKKCFAVLRCITSMKLHNLTGNENKIF